MAKPRKIDAICLAVIGLLEESPPDIEGALCLLRNGRGEEFSPSAYLAQIGINQGIIDDWLALRKVRRAPVTETVIHRIAQESTRAGVSLEYALSMCCQRGWTGFQAEWLERSAPSVGKQADRERTARYLTGAHLETICPVPSMLFLDVDNG